MTTGDTSNGMETRISEWRACVRGRGIPDSELKEQERLLRGEAAALEEAGLEPEEAFLVAVRRIGRPDPQSGRFAPADLAGLWKQLVAGPVAAAARTAPGRPSSFSVWLPPGPRG